MARVAITQNFNDTVEHSIPAITAFPVAGSVSVSGGEINADVLTDDNFDGSGSPTDAGAPTTKKYGKATPTEGRFLRRRLLGLC